MAAQKVAKNQRRKPNRSAAPRQVRQKKVHLQGGLEIFRIKDRVYARLRYGINGAGSVGLGRFDPYNPTEVLDCCLRCMPQLKVEELIALRHASKHMRFFSHHSP